MTYNPPLFVPPTGFPEPLEQLEALAPALHRAWLANGRIVVFFTGESTRRITEDWLVAVKATLAGWPVGKPYHALYVNVAPNAGMGFTPAIRQRFREGMEITQEIPGRTAGVISHTVVFDILQLFLKLSTQRTQRQWRIFREFTPAVNWLYEAL